MLGYSELGIAGYVAYT